MRPEEYQTGDKIITSLNPVFSANDRPDPFKKIRSRLEVSIVTQKLFAFAEQNSPWLRMSPPKYPGEGDHSRCSNFNVKMTRDAGMRLVDVYEAMIAFAAGTLGDYEEPEDHERRSCRGHPRRFHTDICPPFDLCRKHLQLAIPGHAPNVAFGVAAARYWKEKYAGLGCWSGPFDEAQASASKQRRNVTV